MSTKFTLVLQAFSKHRGMFPFVILHLSMQKIQSSTSIVTIFMLKKICIRHRQLLYLYFYVFQSFISKFHFIGKM